MYPTGPTRPGRPTKASDSELLRHEFLWVDTFRGLRDGEPEFEADRPDGTGIFVKHSGQGPGRLYIRKAGRRPRVIREPKFGSTPDEKRRWHSLVAKEEKEFEAIDITRVRVSAKPPERGLWESLKRAKTATEVRRICSRSRIWLKPRLDFPDGSFIEYWYFRRVLHRDAEAFCRAKLDPRYPGRDQRPSGDYRRVEYLARVMAGLTLRLAPSTAVEKLRKMRHPIECGCWRCLRKIAPRYRKSLARLLTDGDWFTQG
jgi:hypothetical protein